MSTNLKNDLSLACLKLKKGEIVAFPTETIYGLGADAFNEKAIKRIFQIKGRPSFNPLICHVGSIELAGNLALLNERTLKIIENFWPGPLTLVLPQKENAPIAPSVTCGLKTIAIRFPSHPVARELLESFPNPIAAPSANKSGELTLLRSTDVWESFQNFEDFNLLEGQTPHIGLESTILDLSEENPLILRSGFITSESIEEILGVPVKNHTPSHHQEIKAPGMMLRHYAPQKSLKMNSLPSSDVLYLGFGKQDGILNLSPSADLIEAAANLYIMIKDLDDLDSDIETIAVAPIPHEGIGIAINDRLKRACGFYDKR